MSEIIKYQGAIKRLLDNYLSASYVKGDVHKASPTIIRGTGGKAKQEITYSGQYKIYTTKDAWNAVEIYFMNRKQSPTDFDQFIDPIEEMLNNKFNLSTNTKWFSKKEFIDTKRFIITDSTIKENLINKLKENLKEIVKLVESTISKKLNEFGPMGGDQRNRHDSRYNSKPTNNTSISTPTDDTGYSLVNFPMAFSDENVKSRAAKLDIKMEKTQDSKENLKIVGTPIDRATFLYLSGWNKNDISKWYPELKRSVKNIQESSNLTESSDMELVKKAIIHIDGKSYTDKVTKVHDEANNYAYQVNGKPTWFSVSRKEVDDFIKWHGKKLQSESAKLTESAVTPFSNKREAMLAIVDVMDGQMTQKNFINQLAAAKRAGTIDEKNFILLLGDLKVSSRSSSVKLEPIIDRLIDKYHPVTPKFFSTDLGESKKLTEAPLAPVVAPAKPAAPAPAAAPVEQGVDPAWKLDMIDFIGNSFQGQAKQFLYQAKKSNPKATPEQITAMVNDLITSNQIVELFKTRFLSSIKAAL